MILSLKNICKQFDDSQVLKDISLELNEGQSVCVMAPSGKGKSTLLSIAGLLLNPTEGEVILCGQDCSTLTDDQKSYLRAETIGFMFQHTQLSGNLRANENISLPANFVHSKKFSNDEIESRTDELLAQFGLTEKKYYFPSQLSIGQKRRIACARALFLKPKLIIADEPTNDLDEDNKRAVIDALFEDVKKENAGLLFATHDEDVAKLADKIIRL